MPLFDKDERELQGVELQEAQRVAKDTYPITPQLHPCRPLVNQETVPDLTRITSPTESVLARICVLEFGLRYGGHIDSLTGIHNELTRRLFSSAQAIPNNWSEQRVIVSISSIISVIFG